MKKYILKNSLNDLYVCTDLMNQNNFEDNSENEKHKKDKFQICLMFNDIKIRLMLDGIKYYLINLINLIDITFLIYI